MARKSLIILGIAIFAGAAFLLLRSGPASPPSIIPPGSYPEPRTEAPPGRAEPIRESVIAESRNDDGISADPEPSVPLPPLVESDSFVRENLEGFSLPDAWVAQDHLLRRLAVLVDNATRGELSRRQLDFAKPGGQFRVVSKDGHLYADPNNAKRFDSYLDRLEAIDPVKLAGLLGMIDPLIDEALGELGSAIGGKDAIRDAIDRILEVPVRTEALELVRPNVLYEYADPDIESLPPLDKQLIRLGPMNSGRLKVYLHTLRAAL